MIITIAYGRERKERDFKAHDISPRQFYLDQGKEITQFEWLIDALRGGEVVIILNKGDLGRGAQVKRRMGALEAKGAIVKVVGEDKPASAFTKAKFTPEESTIACDIWASLGGEATRLKLIEERTGKVKNRDQMNYECLRKPKLQAAKKKTQ